MSHLNVSYVSQTPAVPAAGTSPTAAPATDNPLGFLGALLDQILAGGTAAASTETGAGVDIPGLLNVALENKAEIGRDGDTQPSDLLASLMARLDQLNGQTPSADLKQTIDGLISALGTSATATTSVDITGLTDRLNDVSKSVAATDPAFAEKLQTLVSQLDSSTTAEPDADALTIAQLVRALLGHGKAEDDAKADKAAADASTKASQSSDDLLKILASLGLSTGPGITTSASTDVSADASVSASTTVPQPLLRLSNQLTQLASELTATKPELAQKLEAVATRLVSTDADPNLLGKLTSAAAQSDTSALDKLVQSLIDTKPVTTPAPAAPQIAAPQQLPVPAPIAPQKSKSAVAEVKAAPPEPAPLTADSAPKPAQNVTLAAAAQEPAGDPKPEAKAEAKVSAVLADTAKSDPAAQSAQAQPQQPPAVAAQQARPLPAAYQPVANPINMGQVAFEMVRQVHQGTSRFTIRLDPPELGRVDVRMHVDNTGTVNARLTVDRPETLDLFQRDRQSLERARSQAGLHGSQTNHQITQRQQNHNPFAGMMGDQRQQNSGYGSAPRFATAGNDDQGIAPAVTLYRGTASAGGVNIFA